MAFVTNLLLLQSMRNVWQKVGHPVKVTKAGFFVSPRLFFLGCSPDGKVVDPSSEDVFGLVEVKCPSSKFNVTPWMLVPTKHFVLR